MSNSDISYGSRKEPLFFSDFSSKIFLCIVIPAISVVLIALLLFAGKVRAQEVSVTYPVYHVHTGDASIGSGCYGAIVGYDREPRYCGGSFVTDWGVGYDEKYYCDRCGAWGGPGGNCDQIVGYNDVPIYGLSCGHSQGEEVGYVTYTQNTTDWTKDVYINMSYDSRGMGVSAKPYIMNGTAYDNGSFHITENGSYTFSLATDANSDSSAAVYIANIGNIDRTAPRIVSYTLDPTAWTKDAVTLSVLDVQDPQPDGSPGSGLPSAPYSYDGGQTWTDRTTCNFTQNGYYSVTVRDKADNIAIYPFSIFNIDKEAPRILSCNYDHAPNQKSVTLVFSCDDVMSDGRNGAGLDGSPYSYDGGRTWTAAASTTITHNTAVDFRCRDKLGNISQRTVVIDNIDDNAPQISYTLSESAWTKSPVNVTFGGSDKNPNGSNGVGLPSDCYSYDGGHSWTANNIVKVTDNKTVTVTLRDKNGNTSVKNVDVRNIDHTAPVIKGYTLLPAEWTKDKVTFTVSSADDRQPDNSTGCGLDPKPYSYDGGQTWTEKSTHDFSSNGSFTVKVRDKVGNTSSVSFTVSNIDREAPRILGCDYDHAPNQKNVTLAFSCDDIMSDGRQGSGLESKAYSYDGGQTWTSVSSLTLSHNASVDFRCRDKVGNISGDTVIIDNIDDNAPQISYELSESEWTKGPVMVNFSGTDKNPDGTDGVGLPEDCYSYDGGHSWTKDNTLRVTDNKTVSVTLRDKNGNTSVQSIDVHNIDHTAPRVKRYTLLPIGWTKDKVTLTVNSADDIQPDNSAGCGLDPKPYSYDSGQTWTDKASYSYLKNGEYKVLIRDRLSNTATLRFMVETIDTEPPRIISCDYDHTKNLHSLEIIAVCDDMMTDGRLGSGLADRPYSYDGGQTWTDNDRYTITHNTTLKFMVRDRLGNSASKELSIKNIDDYPPEVKHTLSTDEWTIGPVEVIFDPKDNNPGDSPGIGLPDDCFSYDGGQTWTDDSKVIVTDNSTIEVQVKDKNDNITVYSIDVTNIDHTPPTVTGYSLKPASDWVKEGVTFVCEGVTDPQPDGTDGCGSDRYPYSYDNGKTWSDDPMHLYEDNGDHTVLIRDALSNTAKIEFNISNIDHEAPRILGIEYDDTKNLRDTTIRVKCDDMLADGRQGAGLNDMPYSYDGGQTWTDKTEHLVDANCTVDFLVRDKLDNTASQTVVIDFIDEFAPTVSHSLYPGSWTNGNVEVSFETVDINQDKSEGIGLPYDCYSYDSGSSWTDESAVTVSENSYIQVAVRDKNGNTDYYSLDVTNIDKNAPVISASCKYVANKKAAILYADGYDDASGIDWGSFLWTGPESGSGSTYAVGTDGLYTVTCADRAGNIATSIVEVSGLQPGILHPAVDRITANFDSEIKKILNRDKDKGQTVEKIMPKIAEKGKDENLNLINDDNARRSISEKIKDWWSSLSILQKILITTAVVTALAGLLFLLWIWYRSAGIYCDMGDGKFKFLGIGCIHIRSGVYEFNIVESVWDRAETTKFRIIPGLLFAVCHRGKMLYVYFPEDRVKGGKIVRKIDILV